MVASSKPAMVLYRLSVSPLRDCIFFLMASMAEVGGAERLEVVTRLSWDHTLLNAFTEQQEKLSLLLLKIKIFNFDLYTDIFSIVNLGSYT